MLDAAGIGLGFLQTEMKCIHEEFFEYLVAAVYVTSSFNTCGSQGDKTIGAVIDEAAFRQRLEDTGHGSPPDIQ